MASAVDAPLLTNLAISMFDERLPEASRTQEEGAFLARHMVYCLLNDSGIKFNGYRDGPHKSTHKLEQEFRTTVETFERSCLFMKKRHNDEITQLVRTLDISDARLHQNFQKSVNTLMVDGIRWGRIVALFYFTSVLAERLYKEGHQSKIESLIGWLSLFSNETVVPWVSQQRGGWAAIKDAVNTDVPPVSKASTKVTDKAQNTSSAGALFALAAVGVGAFVVGTLAIR